MEERDQRHTPDIFMELFGDILGIDKETTEGKGFDTRTNRGLDGRVVQGNNDDKNESECKEPDENSVGMGALSEILKELKEINSNLKALIVRADTNKEEIKKLGEKIEELMREKSG